MTSQYYDPQWDEWGNYYYMNGSTGVTQGPPQMPVMNVPFQYNVQHQGQSQHQIQMQPVPVPQLAHPQPVQQIARPQPAQPLVHPQPVQQIAHPQHSHHHHPQPYVHQPSLSQPGHQLAPQLAPQSAPQPQDYIMPVVVPQQQDVVYGYYYPYAYAPRMAPTSLPSPTSEGTFDDYEEGAMVEFLATHSYAIMSNGTNMWNDIQVESFQRFVQGVLRSTRLSKHTILLSLQYLANRWSMGKFADPLDCDYDMYYLMFVVSLALANKVHDDNTFTNASWCQATGIPAAQITKAESHWLKVLDWDFEIKGTAQWYHWHDRYQAFLQQRQRTPLTPPGLWAPNEPVVANVGVASVAAF